MDIVTKYIIMNREKKMKIVIFCVKPLELTTFIPKSTLITGWKWTRWWKLQTFVVTSHHVYIFTLEKAVEIFKRGIFRWYSSNFLDSKVPNRRSFIILSGFVCPSYVFYTRCRNVSYVYIKILKLLLPKLFWRSLYI